MSIPNLCPWQAPLRSILRGAAVAAAFLALGPAAVAQVALADEPVLSTTTVPGNLALPLSVEFPTAVSVANIAEYAASRDFLGYFNPARCYAYNYDANEANRYFYPTATTTTRSCSGAWSGSFLNWATMQTIDPFRKVLTGGYRSSDTTTVTILEKAWASGQGGEGNFPNRTIYGAGLVGGATPFGWGEFRMRVQGLGNRLRFSNTGDVNAGPTAYNPAVAVNGATTYEVSVRVRVCNPAAVGGIETNCVAYGSNYKPEGLIQEYSNRIRYSAFGYLNDDNINRDGAVLRARMKFVGPSEPRPGLPATTNTAREWDPATGVFVVNPDTADATASGVTNSGVINYLNKFGASGTYKTYDPVGELYYAAVRYFKNLGNVTAWSELGTASSTAQRNTWVDGFPVITNWGDPIQYSCQRNYILGIGDVNTHADKNVPGPTSTATEPTKPAEVVADTTVNAVAQTNLIGFKEGYTFNAGDSLNWGGCCSNNGTLMAGLAYDAHVRDIRPDDAAVPHTRGMQTISTYWLDVLEYQVYDNSNQFWLATKYGGFRVPNNYDAASTAALPTASWHSSGRLSPTGQQLPDNYFTATAPEEIEAGLRAAFASIAADLSAVTTSFSTAAPQVTESGNASYSAQYDAGTWTGTVTGSEINFGTNGVVSQVERWNSNSTLASQLAGSGWNTNRRVITWSGTTGVPFRSGTGGITAAQLTALDTPYGAGVDGTQYLNYLRGERCNEVGATTATYPTCSVTPLGYRPRTGLLGDIDGSKVTAVGPPNAGYGEASNPGYAAFRTTYANRTPMVYVGANDGMLHAFNGLLTGTGAGSEVFAFVPSALYNGPSSAATPATDGLVARGNPNFVHRSFANGTARAYDIDFARATGAAVTGNPTPNWRTVLIGGLGKGGRSYYAINVTDPLSGGTPTEATMAGRVLWEFPSAGNATHASAIPRMGFTYGEPVVTKTPKYGWVVIFPSGYNSVSGGSYLFFVNPSNGNLLETVTVGTAGEPSAGLAHIQALRNLTSNLTESLYGGDLNGNLWRIDVRAASGTYPTPVNIARFTAPTTGNPRQPVTSRPLIEIDPATGRRFVMVGTGRLLDDTDIGSTDGQSFYAIIDGTESTFNTAASLPTGVSFPITRTNLAQNTDTTLSANGVTLGTTSMGWYIDLPRNSANVASRVVLDPTTSFRTVAFATLLPAGDACTPSGTSRVYLVNFGTGESRLSRDRAYVETTSAVVDLRFLSVAGGSPRLYVGGQGTGGSAGGGGGTGSGNLIVGAETGVGGGGGGGGPNDPNDPNNCSERGLVAGVCAGGEPWPPLRRLNWREILLPQ